MKISVVVPVYNEANNVKVFLGRILPVLQSISSNYEIIFCLDPSTDETEKIICNEIVKNRNIRLLKFSRRFGQPAATLAGIFNCAGDVCVVIDVDLQDPPELIRDMFELMCADECEVVYAKRRTREGETLIKRAITHAGYFLINKFSEVNIPRNTGDFRIMSRRVVEELRALNESHGFLRGLVAYVGFKQGFVEYDRDVRFSGAGNYNRFTGSLKIGLNGLISFSSKPLFVMSIAGFALSGFSFLLGGWYVVQKLIGFNLTPGLSTTVLFISFFSGVQLLGLGLIGEYVGRIYEEVKRRPLYIVDKKINFDI